MAGRNGLDDSALRRSPSDVERQPRLARRLAVAIVLLVLAVATVAVASRGGLQGGRSAAKPPRAHLDYALSAVFLLYIAAIPVTVYAYLLVRRDVLAGSRSRRQHRFATAAAIALFMTLLAIAVRNPHEVEVLFHRLNQIGVLLRGGERGSHGAHSAAHSGAHHPSGPRFRWPVLAAVLPLLAAMLPLLATAVGADHLLRRRSRQTGPIEADDARLNRDLSAAISEGIDDLLAQPDARRAVIAAYARMEDVLRRHGIPRDASETPAEYLSRVLERLAAQAPQARRLTALFETARFSSHPIDEAMRREAVAALTAIRDDLRGSADAGTPDDVVAAHAPRVDVVRTQLLSVAPIRAALGIACLLAARALGEASSPALLAFAFGATALTIAAVADPRRRLRTVEPPRLPLGALHSTARRAAARAIFPSTIGLTVLAALAAVRQPVLTALLGGVLLGLALAALFASVEIKARERRYGGRIYLDSRTRRLYLGPVQETRS